ncbi:MAG: B12-binding domain-containing radical SAM protein [Acidobacteriia bacterium]|nr:B12-binding domain-containing radical SAM protein [Terriglobia bacterium]
MRILLVLPAGENVRVTSERPEVPKRAMLRFSVLSLTIVAALTPRRHEVRIVDENVEPLDFESEVDLVGITFMTALAPRAYEIARRFRARGKFVVGGGFHPTLCPAEAAEHLDAVVVGDAEGAWERLLQDVEAGQARKVYVGKACPAEDIRTPIPRRDLLAPRAKQYVTINAVQTGRGCQHACRYCSVTAFHEQSYRQRPIVDVIAELRGVPRDFIFVDDNIVRSPQYARELFQEMLPLRKRWVGQCSIEIADDAELLPLAHDAGCRGLFIGIETANQDNLASVGKQFNDSGHYRERLRRIRRQGIGVVAGMIVGLDQDEPGIFESCLRFLQRQRIDALQLNILTPLPGTPLFHDIERTGRITDCQWDHYDFRHVVFRPRRMTAVQLQEGANWLYSQFYRADRILVRFLRTLWTCGWIPALLGLRLNLTYRYDNRRERIRGRNPAL